MRQQAIEGKHIHEILEHGKILSPIVNSNDQNIATDDVDAKESEKEASGSDVKKEDIDTGVEPAGAPA